MQVVDFTSLMQLNLLSSCIKPVDFKSVKIRLDDIDDINHNIDHIGNVVDDDSDDITKPAKIIKKIVIILMITLTILMI